MIKKIAVIMCVVLAFFSQKLVAKLQQSDENVFEAAYKSGFESGKMKLEVNGTYKGGLLGEEQKDNILDYIKCNAQLTDENVKIESSEGKYYIVISATYEIDNIDSQSGQAMEKKKLLENICKEAGFDIKSYMTFYGECEGELPLFTIREIIDESMGSLGCSDRDISFLNSEKLDCVCYGYSPVLKDCVTIGKEKINITMAFTYDEEKDVTIVYYATPVLNESI